jgi:hypothetical protein
LRRKSRPARFGSRGRSPHHSLVGGFRRPVRFLGPFRPIFMQQKPAQIITNFGPDTVFEVAAAIETDTHPFQIDELLVLPMEEQSTRISLNPLALRGIPFSAIND